MSIKCVDGGQLLLDFGYEKKPYIRDTFSITEQTGFLSPEQQISRMMAAGVNLMSYRRDMYDFPDGNFPDDVSPDPTQRVGFDMADASEIIRSVASSKTSSTDKVKEVGIEGSGEKCTVSPSVDSSVAEK